ncbi:polymorphic toxin-type HINT domain-containing protein [Streptomyces katrae]|uniref:polymorphic toxin-type HINT domain-containing protein n=1 Tax=Streptomyces katrae TaxID=68223 RepID=UPI000692142C|nr:polymorphic toxin-type HINT domain-containing protein [Streptomyces katrae]
MRGIAEASAQAEASANGAADAALAAVGAALNSLAAAGAATDAGDASDAAGASSAQARAAADSARRYANEAKRAASKAADLARRAAGAARDSRLAAESAANHAENAAKAADDAAEHAGEAADAAAKSTAHAAAAATAAIDATNAVDKARDVYKLAREIEAEGLLGRTNAGLEHATDLRAQEDQRRKDKAQAAQQTKDLTAQAKALSVEAAQPGVDVKAIAAKARKVALKTAQTQGGWSEISAHVALAGSDTDINQYARTGWTEAAQQDERALVARLAEDAGAASIRGAAEQALKSNAQAVTAFLTTGQYQVGADEFGVHIAQIIDGAGPILQEAGRKALKSGDPAQYRQFIETGQHTARVEDERVRAAELASIGGPELAAAARIAVHSSDAEVHKFIQNGQHRAQRKDLLAANHQERVLALIAESAEIAATAHQDAAEAAKVAALARDKSDEANDYAQQAAASAAAAKTFADQAAASAAKAKEAANRAAQSAKAARDAAARAEKAADEAGKSAADAEISAQSARTSASLAWAAAARAKDSALAAGKDFGAALQASKEAYDAYTQKYWEAEERRRNDPGEQARRQYRCGFAGTDCMTDKQYAYWCIKKPACMLATEFGEALEPYNDDIRFIGNELLGLSNLYTCFNGSGLDGLWACAELTRDVAINSKIRALRAGFALLYRSLKGCKCFPAGTRVLMGNGSSRNIEDIKVGDSVRATDPVSGYSVEKKVTRSIATEDDKYFNELTIETRQGPRKLTATFEHPFWSPTVNRWLEAREFGPGDELLTSSGDKVRITANRTYAQHARTYNLTVDDLHTYYVLAGATPVLVHNADCVPDLGDSWRARETTDLPTDKGGCEGCALHIIDVLGGGEVMRISVRPGMGHQMWRYRGKDVTWDEHFVAVKDGRVFDAWTGRLGESMDEYMAQWEDAAELYDRTFGKLTRVPNSNRYTFTPNE